MSFVSVHTIIVAVFKQSDGYNFILFKFHRTETDKNLTADSSSTDVKSFFSNCNVAALRQLGGGRVLLDLCLSLPEFSKIASKPAGPSPMMSLTSSR